MTKLINAYIVAFSIICIALGALAYFAPREGHSASIVSLIAAGSIGVLMLASLAIWKYVSPRGGRIMSVILTVVCLGNFVPKGIKNGFYPNGLMAILSGLLLVLLIAGHVTAKSASAEPKA